MPLFPVRRDADSAAFFDGTANDQFFLIRDNTNGTFLDPTADISIDADRFAHVPAAGTGRIISWSVVHSRDATGPTRTVVGIVEFDEGPWWWGEIVADPDAELQDARVHVAFVPSGGAERDERVPQFVLD